LRFLHVDGEIPHELAGAVPSVAGWRLASLVKALDARSVARLLASCDRRTRVGRRDFAIITMLSRLGLRAGEIAALQLRDVDWRAGEIMVRGKGSRQERLPLPADVGETLAGWLERGRPRRDLVFVFTRLRAPHGGLSAGAVSQIVPAGRVAACWRAPAAAHGRDRDAARGRELDRGRPGPAPPRPGCHFDLREGRPTRARRGRCAVAWERGMSTLAEHAQNYLTLRRALGFKLVGEGQLLAEFVACADATGQRTVTTQFALEWARRPTNGSRNYLSRRLRAVRGFARYLHAFDPACEIPPLELLPPASTAPRRTSTATRRSSR